MATIFTTSGMNSTDFDFVVKANQQLVYDDIMVYVGMAMQAQEKALATFVQSVTTMFQERYQLPVVGRMQQVTELTRGNAVARYDGYNVGYPIKQYSDSLVQGLVDMAYTTPDELEAHVDGIITRARNVKRHEILRRLFKSSTDSHTDKRYGTITVQPLANGDSVNYPPVEGSDTEATDNHYLESGYAATAINDTNNPYLTLANELIEHTGDTTGDVPIIAFIHPDEQPETEALTGFTPYVPAAIQPGSNTDSVLRPPGNPPGKTIGYVNGLCWVQTWRWMPTGYIVAVNTSAPAPLKMRVDPADTGLGAGNLLPFTDDEHPLQFRDWMMRFGVGCGNRLGAAVMELGTGGTYTVPTIYQT